MDFPIYKYPTNAPTDPNVLYRNLGSFWTKIFKDKAALKGMTIGLAEELIQRYYDLVEVINSYSVSDVPIFHTEKWKPIIVYKSLFNTAPFRFKQDDAIFGPQTASDVYYANVVFQFGFPKRPSAEVYTYDAGSDFKNFGIIADRIFNPKVIFTNGTDVYVDSTGVLFFNKNFFDDPLIVKTPVIEENGEPKTYTDKNGDEQQEEFVILWAYHAELDKDILFNTFGYIFNLNLGNDAFFKDLLNKLFNLYIDGPTVRNIVNICSTFLGIKTIIEDEETVSDVFTDSLNKYVVTDKNVYKFDLLQNIKSSVTKGKVLAGGDTLVDAIEYYDNVVTPNWWKSSTILKTKLALSQYLFLGDYQSQLVFPNTLDIITLNSDGDIVFPVIGHAADVELFHNNLNADNTAIKAAFNLVNPGDSAPFIPVDFLMENFLKQNTAFIKFRFGSNEEQSRFLSLLPLLRKQLPPYVYVIFDLELSITEEEYSNLNSCITIDFGGTDIQLSADGSDSAGEIESLAPHYYKNAKERLFEISRGIPDIPYEYVGTVTALADSAYTTPIAEGRVLTMKDGVVLREPAAGDTTVQFNRLQLIGFI